MAKTLQLFGVIDDETTKEFLQSIPASGDLVLEINSPGGDVFDGFTIFDKLKDRDGKIKVEVLGIAASMASVIAMVGDEINIREKAKIMIHNPFTGAFGDAKKFKQAAKNLEEITQDIVNIYSERTGIKPEEITDMMDSETWLSATEAVEKGFANKVLASNGKLAGMYVDQCRVYGYKNIPELNAGETQMLDEIKKALGVTDDKDVLSKLLEVVAALKTAAEFVETQKKEIADLKKSPGSIKASAEVLAHMAAQDEKIADSTKLVESLTTQLNGATEFIKGATNDKRKSVLNKLVEDGYMNGANLEVLEKENPSIFEVPENVFNSRLDFIKAGGTVYSELNNLKGLDGETVVGTPQDKLNAEIEKVMETEKCNFTKAYERVKVLNPALVKSAM